MITLGIESSCDETAVAIVKDGFQILSSIIASQASMHRAFNGVYPEFASRSHLDQMIPTLKAALSEAGVTQEEIDLIAVANRPGLMGSLLMGVMSAKSLALAWNKPLVGVNHVHAHLYSAMMESQEPPARFPSLGLVISGGHTLLVQIHGVCDYEVIGSTVDDAAGESFDKVAVMLGFPYPGGPHIEKLALEGNPSRYPFKGGNVKGKPMHFSYSGLKTNVLYTVYGGQKDLHTTPSLSDEEKADIAASFQSAIISDIKQKVSLALESYPSHALFVGGGVSINRALRSSLEDLPVPVFWPKEGLYLDNAAMIAGLGHHIYALEGSDDLTLTTTPKIGLEISSEIL